MMASPRAIASASSATPSYGASDWKHPGFDDSSWATGQALLGYGAIDGRTDRTRSSMPPRLAARPPTSVRHSRSRAHPISRRSPSAW